MGNIKVSVAMITYNQSDYIEKAVRSVLMQKTNFPYEIIIGDDASTDDTPKIVSKLYSEYPDKIKPILRKVNLGSLKNCLDVLQKCQGEYVAFLEGDDFWTDENKLQKQVDFLSKNREYVAYYHKNCKVDEENNIISEFDSGFCDHENYTYNDINKFTLPGQTATSMIRKDVLDQIDLNFARTLFKKIRATPGDRILALYLISVGKVYCSDQVMSAYRSVKRAGAGNWTSKFGVDNAFVHLHFVKMRNELELLGKKFGVNVDLSLLEYDAFIDACWKWLFLGKKRYFFNVIYMLFTSRHKGLLWSNGIKKVLVEIKNRTKARLKNFWCKAKSEIGGIKRKCRKFLKL